MINIDNIFIISLICFLISVFISGKESEKENPSEKIVYIMPIMLGLVFLVILLNIVVQFFGEKKSNTYENIYDIESIEKPFVNSIIIKFKNNEGITENIDYYEKDYYTKKEILENNDTYNNQIIKTEKIKKSKLFCFYVETKEYKYDIYTTKEIHDSLQKIIINFKNP
jgi:hypothetical protein